MGNRENTNPLAEYMGKKPPEQAESNPLAQYMGKSARETAELQATNNTWDQLKGLGTGALKAYSYVPSLAITGAMNINPFAKIYEHLTGKQITKEGDLARALMADAPSMSEYWQRAGAPKEVAIPLGMAGDIAMNYGMAKTGGELLKRFGKGMFGAAPVFKKTEALLEDGQIPSSEMVWRTGKSPSTANDVVNIIGNEKQIYLSARNQIMDEMKQAGVTGNIKEAMQKAQSYIDRIGDNRELAQVKAMLQKDLDEQVGRLSPVAGRPTTITRHSEFESPIYPPEVSQVGTTKQIGTKTLDVVKPEERFIPNDNPASVEPLIPRPPGTPYPSGSATKIIPINAYTMEDVVAPPVQSSKVIRERRLEEVLARPGAQPEEIAAAKSGVSSQMSPEDFSSLQRSGVLPGYQMAKGAGLKNQLEKMAGVVGRQAEMKDINNNLSSIKTFGKKLEQIGVNEAGQPDFTQLDALSLFDPRAAILKILGKRAQKTGFYTGIGRGAYNLGVGIEKTAPYVSPWLGLRDLKQEE